MNHSLASRIRIIRRHCLLALPAALAFNALAGTPAIPPAEKLLPDDTLLMVAMPDFAKVRELYKTSPQLQLWNDPAMKPFKDKFLAKLREELFQPLERDLGVSVDDYANLPQGQLTVAMTQNGSTAADQQPAGLLLLLDAKDKSAQLKTNLATLRKKWVDAGKALKTANQARKAVKMSKLPKGIRGMSKVYKRARSKVAKEFDRFERLVQRPLDRADTAFGVFQAGKQHIEDDIKIYKRGVLGPYLI